MISLLRREPPLDIVRSYPIWPRQFREGARDCAHASVLGLACIGRINAIRRDAWEALRYRTLGVSCNFPRACPGSTRVPYKRSRYIAFRLAAADPAPLAQSLGSQKLLMSQIHYTGPIGRFFSMLSTFRWRISRILTRISPIRPSIFESGRLAATGGHIIISYRQFPPFPPDGEKERSNMAAYYVIL